MKLKTRTNQPVEYVLDEVESVETLTTPFCDKLKCGDIIVKHDDAGEHAYIVSYKSDDEMSLTYADHQNIEEVYYEKHNGTWAKVVKDITHLAPLEDISIVGGDVVVDADLVVDGDLSVEDIQASGDVVAKTLEQTQANWSFELTSSYLNNGLTGTDMTILYCRLEQIGNILYLVLNLKYENNTESAISGYSILSANGIELPTEIANKLYDVDNENVLVAKTAETQIASFPVIWTKYKTLTSIGAQTLFGSINNFTVAKQVRVSIISSSSFSIGAGEVRYITGRLFLTLI